MIEIFSVVCFGLFFAWVVCVIYLFVLFDWGGFVWFGFGVVFLVTVFDRKILS